MGIRNFVNIITTSNCISFQKVAKKQERHGGRTRVAGLSDIIMRLGGPPLASWREKAHKRESLDKILNKFGKKDDSESGVDLERGKGSKNNKEEDKKDNNEKDKENNKENNKADKEAAKNQGSLKRSRMETLSNTKRMRPNAANISRQDVQVETKLFSNSIFDE